MKRAFIHCALNINFCYGLLYWVAATGLVSYVLGWFFNVCKKLTFQVLHAPELFPLVHWLQNCFSFHSRRFPFHLCTLGLWLLVLHCNNGGYCSKIWCPDGVLVNHGIFQDGISYSDFARFLEDVWNPHLLNKIFEKQVYVLGCPKKSKSPNFRMLLTPVVFVG